MRINNEITNPGADSLQKPVGDSVAKYKIGSTGELSAQSGADANVSLSGRAQEVGRLIDLAANSSEVGAERIAGLKAQFASGSYRIDFDRLAGDFLSRSPSADSF